MERFIIGGNRLDRYRKPIVEVVEAESLREARIIAMKRDMSEGYLDDDLSECWAEPWSFDLAYDLGLAPPYEPLPRSIEKHLESKGR
jgi:hypothetical protein